MPVIHIGEKSHDISNFFDGGAGTAMDQLTPRSNFSSEPSMESAIRQSVENAKRDSHASAASSVAEPPAHPSRCVTCCELCFRCHNRGIFADYEELEKVMKAMKHLTLKEDVVVNGELIPKDSHLLKVGRVWRRQGFWELSSELEEECKEQLKEFIEDEEGVRLTFACPRIRMPWCMVLKAPCCTFFLTFLCVAAICAAGIRGNINIETDTDSFLESDSDASTTYNAFLAAVKDQAASRRLQETGMLNEKTPRSWLSWQGLREDIIEAAGLPVLDTNGRWYPFRYIARAYCLLVGEDFGAHNDNWVEINDDDNHGRRLLPLYMLRKLSLIYVSMGENNVLDAAVLTKMRDVEHKFKQYPEWAELCKDADPPKKKFCEPGFSFVNFAFAHPARQGTKTTLHFNGSGSDSVPMELAVGYAKSQGMLTFMFPEDKASAESYEVVGNPCEDRKDLCSQYKEDGQCQPFAEYEMFMHDFCPKTCNFCGPSNIYSNYSAEVSVAKTKVTAIRSNYHFQAFCCQSGEPSGPGKKRIETAWDNFVAKVVEEMSSSDHQGGDIRIFYSGDSIDTYEALNAVYSDLMWALGSYCFVVVYATLHTRSIFLSTVGLFLVMLSIPSALAIFALASNSETVSLMSCLSIFIVIGIGSDMLFVYTDFWKQSVQQSRDPVKRLKFTYMQAASSTAATTFTTAMSFLANLASVLRPLREFGFFMGGCVIMAWLVMFFGYPPILVLGERCHRRLRRCVSANIDAEEKEEVHGASSLGRKSINMVKNRSTVALVKMLDPEKVGVGEVHKNFLGSSFADFLGAWKCSLFLVFFAITIGSAVISAQQLQQATGAPKIFPPDHNQVLGEEWKAKFATFDDDNANVGNPVTECSDLFEDCNGFQCSSHGRAMGSAFGCDCYPHGGKSGSCTNPSQSIVHLRVLGRQGLTASMVEQADYYGCFKTQYPSATSVTLGTSQIQTYDILMEHWESGKKILGTMIKPDVVTIAHLGGIANTNCHEQQVCYCGIERCTDAGSGLGYGTLELRPPQRELQAMDKYIMADALLGRRLQTPTQAPAPAPSINPENQVDVPVALGLEVKELGQLVGVSAEVPYSFNPLFDMTQPWAQRGLVELCEKIPTVEALKVASTRCWMLGFRDYWEAQGKDFPVRPTEEDVAAQIQHYANTKMTDGFQTTIYFWFEGTLIKATYVVFFLSISNLVSADAALEVMAEWDTYFSEFNEAAEEPIKGAWHASKLWVRAEAEKVIISSTANTLAISLGCVLLGILAFTFSLHLAIMVMLVVLAIIIGLLFFMVVVMEWPIGAIEVLCLIVFVGFAVDYCLHVAHKYHTCHIKQVSEIPPEEMEEFEKAAREDSKQKRGSSGRKRGSISIQISDKPVDGGEVKNKQQKKEHKTLLAKNRPDERFARTKYALERMGGAVVGSACTTVGCAAFLLPCQLVIFTKIGAVVMAVTLYAIIYTVLPLPALLMIMGPCGGDAKRCVRCIVECNRKYGCAGVKEKEKPSPDDDDYKPRRYVLHMPTRAMSEKAVGASGTRTRVTATG